jgi:hypothetical protein
LEALGGANLLCNEIKFAYCRGRANAGSGNWAGNSGRAAGAIALVSSGNLQPFCSEGGHQPVTRASKQNAGSHRFFIGWASAIAILGGAVDPMGKMSSTAWSLLKSFLNPCN